MPSSKSEPLKPVDRELYQKARDQILLTVSIPRYFRDNIDSSVDLEYKDSCLCPFHEENTPSFRYERTRNFWRCFGKCKDGGTVIELHKRKFGFNNHFDAVADMKKRFGKKYGLTFKDFFLTADNADISIEEILKPRKQSVSMEEFMRPSKPSVPNLIMKIENKLRSLKEEDLSKYIEGCILYDNLTVYQRKDVDNYQAVLKQLETM